MIEFKRYPAIDGSRNPMLVTIASGPVIIRDNKVLLDMHGDDDFWKFPGGRLRDDESPQHTAIREPMEELGIRVQLLGDPLVLAFTREREGQSELVVLMHYQAMTSDEPRALRDVREFAWHPVDQLPANCAPNVKPIVEACLRRS